MCVPVACACVCSCANGSVAFCLDRSGWSEGGNGGASPGGSEEEFLEWFVEEVADCDPDGGAVASRARTPEEKVG